MLLMMRIYVLLVMGIRSVMGIGMPISSMVVPNVVVPTVNVVSMKVTVLSTV
jgi:hypothetical protein